MKQLSQKITKFHMITKTNHINEDKSSVQKAIRNKSIKLNQTIEQIMNPIKTIAQLNTEHAKNNALNKYRKLCESREEKKHCGYWKLKKVKNRKKPKSIYISLSCNKYEDETNAKKKYDSDRMDSQILKHFGQIGIIADSLQISFWGIPLGICQKYKQLYGIQKLFEWQSDCLKKAFEYDEISSEISELLASSARKNPHEFLASKPFIYSAPTSGGKSLVAEILVLHNVLISHKKAMYIVPYIAIASEKVKYFSSLLADVNVKVAGMYGNESIKWNSNIDIAVCTYEKANSILNKLIEEENYDCIGIFVMDEFHFINDQERGIQVEYLVSKILTLNDLKSTKIRIVGFSATLGANCDEIVKWMNADYISSNFRALPVELRIETMKQSFNSAFQQIDQINNKSKLLNLELKALKLLYWLYKEKMPTIMFCARKDLCEEIVLKFVSKISYFSEKDEFNNNSQNSVSQLGINNEKERAEILTRLQFSSSGLNKVFAQSIKYGIAFHHSGLNDDERVIIEEGFRNKYILVLVATSTLCTGINTPANAVIVYEPLIGINFMSNQMFTQMIGRAGRTGSNIMGQAFLFLKDNQVAYAKEMLKKKSIETRILNTTSLYKLVADAISSSLVISFQELKILLHNLYSFYFLSKNICCRCLKFFNIFKELYEYHSVTELKEAWNNAKSFFNNTKEFENFNFECQNCIYFLSIEALLSLSKEQFIEINEENMSFKSTLLGKASLGSCLSMNQSVTLYKELMRISKEGLFLFSDLQLIYICCLLNDSILFEIKNHNAFNYALDNLSPEELTFLDSQGVNYEKICASAQKQIKKDDTIKLKRYFTAIVVNEVLKGKTLKEMNQYDVGQESDLLNLITKQISSLCGMVLAFCNRFYFHDYVLLFKMLIKKLELSAPSKLLNLMQIKCLHPTRAAALYDANITNINDVIHVGPDIISQVLINSNRFQRSVDENENTKIINSYFQKLSNEIFESAIMILNSQNELEENEFNEENQSLLIGELDSEIIDENEIESEFSSIESKE